uniref:Transporter n=1 Tax=uncultured Thiotrichaceae bacterium TaxID=298394 RepID=A0A6S6U713_9GAMM|nr:MAG: Transporter [uncultured Thiotrichaceae bacterium]
MMNFLNNLLELSLEAAPWLVLGFALGGLMKALIPTTFLQRHLSGNGIASISKAALLGAPLPLCSCGVIPAALGLRKAGASKPATASFLVSTPETGIDSISITYALMGPLMAIVRPVAALISAITAGILVALFGEEEQKPVISANTSTHCCSSESPPANTESLPQQAWAGIQYAFTQLLDDISFWLAIGMVFAALTQTFLPADFLAQWGQGVVAMLVMILVGIPMYICATASTPVAAGLMMAGMSPGVALVFLLTGPATNISTLGIIQRELGQRSMWLYLSAVAITAVISGLLLDVIVNSWQIDITTQLHAGHDGFHAIISWACLLLIIALVLRNYPLKLRQQFSDVTAER